jgi:hypothetical protein
MVLLAPVPARERFGQIAHAGKNSGRHSRDRMYRFVARNVVRYAIGPDMRVFTRLC